MTKTYVTTSEIKRNTIKLPNELANHPNLKLAKIDVNEDVVTFTLLPADKHEGGVFDVWQYIHYKKLWVQVTFIK
jgi:hypothetical protein